MCFYNPTLLKQRETQLLSAAGVWPNEFNTLILNLKKIPNKFKNSNSSTYSSALFAIVKLYYWRNCNYLGYVRVSDFFSIILFRQSNKHVPGLIFRVVSFYWFAHSGYLSLYCLDYLSSQELNIPLYMVGLHNHPNM